MPYWITETLNGLPLYLLVYVGLGIPWALVLLPGQDRRGWLTVIPVGFLCGAGLITAWMFILGTVGAAQNQPLITLQNIALGGVILALIALAWLILESRSSRRISTPASQPSAVIPIDERLLVVLIAAAVLVAATVTAFWTFTAYDTLWVYGYEARVYTLTGNIPQSIGYYPQFLPLQYTLAQLGGINDHAARAVVPLLHIGAICAAYVLGKFVDGRRTGVVLAALWALYPHVGEWSRAGDLEIPLAFSFTLASAFFLRAWFGGDNARRDALIAGSMFGVAMWTKPTAGAFALGVVLMLVLELIRVIYAVRNNGSLQQKNLYDFWQWFRTRFGVAVLTGLACLPLGGIWYLRNLLLGHDPIDFPPGYWQTLAERGGDDFGFILLAILLVAAYLVVRYRQARRLEVLVGVALVILSVVRSILMTDLFLEDRRMTLVEIGAFVAGFGILYYALIRFLRTASIHPDLTPLLSRLGWAFVLALPYFVVWFVAYSYHYRLLFAVVPLLLLPSAAILSRWISADWVRRTRWKPVYLLALIALAIPGIYSPIPDKFAGNDYLFDGSLPDDDTKIRSGNAALMTVVDGLQVWKEEHPGERLVAAAPGIDPLPFFFPADDIRAEDVPTRLSEIEDADYLIYGLPETRGAYEFVPFFENQVVGAMGRTDIMRRAWGADDGIFRYDVYELNAGNRWVRPQPQGIPRDGEDVVFGGFARYLGYDIGGLDLWQGRRVILHLVFEAVMLPPADYSIFVHLLDNDGNLITAWDNPVARTDTGYYSTLMWEPGEFINEERILSLPEGVAPLGEGYELVIGFYEVDGNERVPVMVNGEPAGDGYLIENRISIVPPRD